MLLKLLTCLFRVTDNSNQLDEDEGLPDEPYERQCSDDLANELMRSIEQATSSEPSNWRSDNNSVLRKETAFMKLQETYPKDSVSCNKPCSLFHQPV